MKLAVLDKSKYKKTRKAWCISQLKIQAVNVILWSVISFLLGGVYLSQIRAEQIKITLPGYGWLQVVDPAREAPYSIISDLGPEMYQ